MSLMGGCVVANLSTQFERDQFGDIIAGSFLTTSQSNGWVFQIRHDGFGGTLSRELSLSFRGAPENSSPELVGSGFQIEVGRDYYVASVFELAAQQVTFYIKDLTNDGPLISSTLTHNRTGLDLRSTLVIGGTVDDFDFGLDGLIDEIRLSNTALSSSELLINKCRCRLPCGYLVPR